MVLEMCEEVEEPVACELFHFTHVDLLLPACVSIAASDKGNEKYANLNFYSCSRAVEGIFLYFFIFVLAQNLKIMCLGVKSLKM